MNDYVDNIYQVDLQSLISPPNPERIKILMSTLARNIGTQYPVKKIANEANLDEHTARKYLDQLANIFILEELPA
jgi:predicted AAA+ superfamily ATPase